MLYKTISFSLFFLLCCCSSQNPSSTSSDTSPSASLQEGIALYEKAQQHLQDRDSEAARRYFQQAAQLLEEQKDRSIATLKALGECNRRIDKYKKGQYYYNLVLQKQPEDYEANLGAGHCQFQLEFYDKAIPHFAKCHKAQPGDAEIMFYLAKSTQKAERGVNEKVRQWYLDSAARGYPDAMYELGAIFQYKGYIKRAVAQYENYLKHGGQLDREAMTWLEQHRRPVLASGDQKPQQDTQDSGEVLMVCPRCGRLGAKDADICEFDGEALEAVQ